MGGEKDIAPVSPIGVSGSPPHGRGKGGLKKPLSVVYGSPPRGRGKAVKFRCTCGLQRITPAWAGKSRCSSAKGKAVQDHPRMGGEKISLAAMLPPPPGSPPHGRGKDSLVDVILAAQRITPAWAGKSPAGLRCWCRGSDHPRMGGEKPLPPFGSLPYWGSPPHGRGKARKRKERMRAMGITPAWAGKSIGAAFLVGVVRDHPRMGGEKAGHHQPTHHRRGSPPHGRGKGIPTTRQSRRSGITPAWAGKRTRTEETQHER